MDIAELLGHHHGERVIEPLAAVFHRLGQSEKTEIAEFLEQLVRGKNAGFLPGVDVRVDLRRDELLQAAAQLLVLGREHHE